MAAEKRQLTILNCDMVDSTVYAEELDPEDFEEILQSLIDISIEVVARNNGVFALNTGDGYEAYFYPGTGSPAAQYAIDCALDIHRSLQARNKVSKHPINVRIGIATGKVVLSPQKLSSEAVEIVAFGRPAHLCARLQSVADPGGICVDDATREEVTQYYDFTNVGRHELKGFNRPIEIWRVDGPRQWHSRFEVRLSSLSPLVGRNSEIELLLERWEAAEDREGQAVVVIGEPGIGKSRLIHEVCNRIDQKPLILQCLENFENTPLHPWTRLLEAIAETRPLDTLDERKSKLCTVIDNELGLAAGHRDVLLALVTRSPNTAHSDEAIAKQQLEELCAAIADIFLERAKTETQLIIVEDLHWIDPTSKMLLDHLLDRIEQSAIFILITSRPQNLHSFSYSEMMNLPLNRLTRRQALSLLTASLENVSKEQAEEIVRWTDGIPLFLEEMAKTMVETATDHLTDQVNDDLQGLSRPSVPNSLEGPLLARIDRLGDAKQVAQIASVIGREFNREIVALLMDEDLEAINKSLAILVESGIVIALDSGRENFTFKHALIQDVLYKNLLDRDAVQRHRQLASIYLNDIPGMRNSQPEIIAYHLSLGHEWESAAEFWLSAGLLARDSGSSLEALGRLEHGLEAVEMLDDEHRAKQLKSHIQMIRGQIIIAYYGPVNQDGQNALEEAVSIGEELGDSACVVSSQTQIMWLQFDVGRFQITLSAADKLIDYAKRVGHHQASAVGLLGSGMCSFAMGSFNDARESLEESLDYLKFNIEPIEGYPGKAYTYLGLINHVIGNPDKALALCNYAIDITVNHTSYDLAAALGNSLYLNVLQNRLDLMEETSRRLMKLADDTGFKKWYYQGVFFLGGVQAARHDLNGLEMMQEAIDRFEQAQELVELSIFYGLLADRYLITGNVEQAMLWVDKALRLVESYEERFVEVPLLRLKAHCLEQAEIENRDKVSELRFRADRIAHEQGALIWQPGFDRGDSTPASTDSLSYFT